MRAARVVPMVATLVVVAAGCSSGPASTTKASFPPQNLTAFKALAGTGQPSQVQPVGTSSAGQRSCPDTTVFVTVPTGLTGRPLEADLSAFFVHSGFLGNQCPASVYAYYSKSQYQADGDLGFTAGSVVLTVSGPQSNLEVEAGVSTPGTDSVKSQFSFNF